jgi:hypothetical protein
MMLQRYNIAIAVYEYFADFFRFFLLRAVIWSFVICQNREPTVKNRHYIINILYLYIVSNDRVPEIDFDHFDLDHLDQNWGDNFCIFVHEMFGAWSFWSWSFGQNRKRTVGACMVKNMWVEFSAYIPHHR